MNFADLMEKAKVEAIKSALMPDSEYLWRMKCREYSQKYFTPLHQVYEMDPEFVLRNLYETLYLPHEIKDELEDILNELRIMKDPNFEKVNQEEIENLVDAVINKENKRKNKKEVSLPTKAPKPKSGGLNFGDLLESEIKDPNNQNGFSK